MHDNAEQKEKEREIRNGRIINGKGSYVEVLDSYRNLAPILDAVSADTDDSGQVRQMSYPFVIKSLSRFAVMSLAADRYVLWRSEYRLTQYRANRG